MLRIGYFECVCQYTCLVGVQNAHRKFGLDSQCYYLFMKHRNTPSLTLKSGFYKRAKLVWLQQEIDRSCCSNGRRMTSNFNGAVDFLPDSPRTSGEQSENFLFFFQRSCPNERDFCLTGGSCLPLPPFSNAFVAPCLWIELPLLLRASSSLESINELLSIHISKLSL